jgi:peptidyl-tRNA hydrolase
MNKKTVFVFGIGSRQMFNTGQLTVHGIGLGYLQWVATQCMVGEWAVLKSSAYFELEREEVRVIYATNLTSVNQAATGLKEVLAHFQVVMPDTRDLYVVQDDTSLPANTVKQQYGKSSAGGHRGVKDIARFLKSSEFNRLKVGWAGSLGDAISMSEMAGLYAQLDERLLERIRLLANLHTQELNRKRILSAINEWLNQHRAGLQTLDVAMNPDFRRRKGEYDIPICVVLPAKLAQSIQTAVTTITETLVQVFASYRAAKSLPGKHEIVDTLERYLNPTIRQMISAVPVLSPSYFNIDFHGPAADGTTDITVLEMNSTLGAPCDVPLLEQFFAERGLPAKWGVTSMSTLPGSMLSAIADNMIIPMMSFKPDDMVVVVDGDRHDGLDQMIYEELKRHNHNVAMCKSCELTVNTEARGIYYEGKHVHVLWYIGSSRNLASSVLDAIAARWVNVVPSPALRMFTNKAALPLLADSNIRKNVLGIGGLQEDRLSRLFAFASMVTPPIIPLLHHMVSSGGKVAIKPLIGGGGRGVEVLQMGGPDTNYILNSALEANNASNPYIVQGYAPRFILDDTYEYDIRALVLDVGGKLQVQYDARLYRRDEEKLLASVPVYVMPEQQKAKKLLPCKCNHCGNGFPEKFSGKPCPRCHQGEVVSVAMLENL